jgi:hypothetical protein
MKYTTKTIKPLLGKRIKYKVQTPLTLIGDCYMYGTVHEIWNRQVNIGGNWHTISKITEIELLNK